MSDTDNNQAEDMREMQRAYKKSLLGGDCINHPEHYTVGIETTNYIESWGMDFIEGNIIKYVSRYKYKRGIQDLKKAEWYLRRLIHKLEKENKNG